MASITRIKNRPSPWLLQWRDESRKQRSKSFKRAEDAEAYKRMIDASMSRMVVDIPLWTAAQIYLSEVESTCTKATLAHYIHALKKISADIGKETPVERITPEYLASYRDRLASRLAPKTVKNHLISIRAFCSFCVRRGWVLKNPVSNVKLPRGKSKTPKWLTVDQSQRLVEKLKDAPPVIRLALTIALRSGLRLGDLAALRWDSIRDGNIHVNEGKSRHPRIVPMHPQIAELLKGWPVKGDYIFPSRVHKLERANTNALGNKCRNWLKENRFSAGVHSLRHTFATQIAEAGATMTDLKALMGQTSTAVAEIYLHSTRSRQADLISQLGQPRRELHVLRSGNGE